MVGLKSFSDPWGSSFIPGRTAMFPVTLCGTLSIWDLKFKEA